VTGRSEGAVWIDSAGMEDGCQTGQNVGEKMMGRWRDRVIGQRLEGSSLK
jgi:hypothetical protein